MTPSLHALILDNLTSAVFLLAQDLRLLYLNPAAEILLESSAQRAVGRKLSELLPNARNLIQGIQGAVRTQQAFTEHERVLRLSEHRKATVTCTVTPLLEDTTPQVLVELVSLDRQLRICREEHLLNQHKATRAVVRGLAHEIKNPLGGLRGAAQLLERELPDPELKEYTHIIIGEADRLQGLMDRILGPRMRPCKMPLDVHEVLERVRTLIAAEAPPQVTVQLDYDPSIPRLQADRDLLIQAVLNIARNALQAVNEQGMITFRSRVWRQYTIGTTRHRLVARLEVIDNGPGIPEELIEQIFFPMVTTREQGRGLGLSIAQELVNLHGGMIECASAPGHTQFSILLPIE